MQHFDQLKTLYPDRRRNSGRSGSIISYRKVGLYSNPGNKKSRS